MSFPQWPLSSGSASSGGWTRRSPCNGNCIFVAIDVTTVTGRGKKPCMLQPSEQHTVTYRNIGGVSVSLTLSGRACRGLIFVETGKPHWSETVIAKARGEWENAKPATVARTVDTSAHPGGSGVIDFDFAINDPGLNNEPAPVRLSFFI